MSENFVGVGERIGSKIKEMKIKQIDVSKATGISKNALSNYISGNRIPDTLSIYKLAKYFSVSIEWLLTGEETSNEPKPLELTPDEIELLQLFRQLTHKSQMKTIGYIESELSKQIEKDKSSILKHGEDAATNETA